ncbi:hypothetical protein BDZ89DRAFT_619829 [Hymenopellis radicata]|nr:hypothetical protein BDZ89DRAFT_619829 [Hymenopellis radicata]
MAPTVLARVARPVAGWRRRRAPRARRRDLCQLFPLVTFGCAAHPLLEREHQHQQVQHPSGWNPASLPDQGDISSNAGNAPDYVK